MDADEAPDGFELETWMEIIHGSPSSYHDYYHNCPKLMRNHDRIRNVFNIFPYYHYYAKRMGQEGLLESYERGGMGWRPRLETAGPWPRVAEAYEQLVAADAQRRGFDRNFNELWFREITDPARRPESFTKGMFGSPQTAASPRAFSHLSEATAEEAVCRYGDTVPRPGTSHDERDPRIDVRKLLNREIYDLTLWCCHSGCYPMPSWRQERTSSLPSAEEAAEGTQVYVRSVPIGADAPRGETVVEVLERECVDAAKALQDAGFRPAVLNLANRQHPGGSVLDGARAQEESLFRRSTLALSLYPFDAQSAGHLGLPLRAQAYPLDRDEGSVYSRGVVFFRGHEAEDCPFLAKPFALDVVTVPALNRPTLAAPQELCPEHAEATKRKMRAILRACFHGGNDAIVLGAFGCGAFRNPPAHIARLFHEVFEEPEFRGVFRRLTFAILDDHNSRHAHNPEGNLIPFQRVFA